MNEKERQVREWKKLTGKHPRVLALELAGAGLDAQAISEKLEFPEEAVRNWLDSSSRRSPCGKSVEAYLESIGRFGARSRVYRRLNQGMRFEEAVADLDVKPRHQRNDVKYVAPDGRSVLRFLQEEKIRTITYWGVIHRMRRGADFHTAVYGKRKGT